jgi:hypothetical protein
MVITVGRTPNLGELFGQGFAAGMNKNTDLTQQKRFKDQEKKERASSLREALYDLENDEEYQKLPIGQRASAITKALAEHPEVAKDLIANETKTAETYGKREREAREVNAIFKASEGQELSEDERSDLSPASARTIAQVKQPKFESEYDKLMAKNVVDSASRIDNAHAAAFTENARLGRMEELSNKGKLSSPMMIQALDWLGVPIAVLNNPDNEEYRKLEKDFVRDVNNVFRGAIRVFEIQAYLDTVPQLINSPEGRKSIMRSRRIMNEMAEVEFQAKQEILQENNGRLPMDFNYQLDKRIAPIKDELAQKLKGEIKQGQNLLPPVTMYDKEGRVYRIPPGELEEASRTLSIQKPDKKK